MRNADDASETGRRLAELRWRPEVRLRSAVQAVMEQAPSLTPSTRAELESLTAKEGTDD
jgi:hypothetical protein